MESTAPSIYSILSTSRGDEWPPLPDEEHARAKHQSAWSYGAVDGMYSHHGGGPGDKTFADQFIVRLRELFSSDLAVEPEEDLKHLPEFSRVYSLVSEKHTLSWLEAFELGVSGSGLDPKKLHGLGRVLARTGKHREAVKAGLAMMSLVSGIWDRETFLTLGSHDEFTLFAAVAIRRKTLPDEGDRLLLELAQRTTGWGRIHAVERLDGSADPIVRDWLLREGHENDVMHEYTALICARTIHLPAVLKESSLDREALRGAGDILAALLSANLDAAEGMDSYEDGAEACDLWLRRFAEHAGTGGFAELEDFARIALIHDKATNEIANPEGMDGHWLARANRILEVSGDLLQRKVWRELAGSSTLSEDLNLRVLAKRVLDRLENAAKK